MKQAYPAFLLSLTLLAGCGSVGPDYSAPVLPAAQRATSFGAPIAGLGPGEVEVQWWQVFDEPALSQLIQQALAANHDIGIAAARLDEAKALLRESRQGFLPSGGAALGYEHRQRSEVETPFGEQRSIETTRAAVDAAWEIDLFGRVRRSVEAAQALAGSRQALLRSVQASVAATVAATWFELQGIEAEQAVVADISQSQRDSLGLVGQMVSVGAATEFDRLRAEALLRNVEAVAPDLAAPPAAESKPINPDDRLWLVAREMLQKAGQMSGPDLLGQLEGLAGSTAAGKHLLVRLRHSANVKVESGGDAPLYSWVEAT
ncbi:hypothetical protein ALP29_00745 [Pseudomonas syringae pv. avii]|uniref:RND transporter n=1 Tax=Pseudomonas syringae pv. avii TaxID=663959 RepID=A0A3M5U2R8_PSESX|nr:hypothetical protein ALP29_00745 [Pseudomonas syringae pv. avii]